MAAGEGSGDELVAGLIGELADRVDVSMLGAAGPRMRAGGAEAVIAAEDLSGFGLVEVVRRAPRFLRALDALERAAVRSGARVALTVDQPDLFLALGRRLKRRGIAVVHWVAPQVWAWRPGRVRTVARSADTVLCLFPFEPALFMGHVRALFVGHPAAALEGRPPPRSAAPRVALCPGSRDREVRALWPVFREVARALRTRWPEATFVVPVAPTVDRSLIGGLDCTYVGSMAEVAGADVALTASGTATLQLAALDVPMVVAYRVHPLTAMVARRLLTIDAVALPNVLAGRRLVPEHLQELDVDAIAADVVACRGLRGQVPRELLASLEPQRALANVADEVARWVTAAS